MKKNDNRKCEVCPTIMVNPQTNKKFCSPICRASYHNAKYKASGRQRTWMLAASVHYLYYAKIIDDVYGTRFKIGISHKPEDRKEGLTFKRSHTTVDMKILETFPNKSSAKEAEDIVKRAYKADTKRPETEFFYRDVLGEFI